MADDIQITDNSKIFKDAMQEGVEAALEAIGMQAESHAKRIITQEIPRNPNSWYTPTGNLRNSISHTHDKDTAYIGSNLEYAVYNELGTGKYAGGTGGGWWFKDAKGEWHYTEGMKGIHFLGRAVSEHLDEYKNIAHNEIKKHLP